MVTEVEANAIKLALSVLTTWNGTEGRDGPHLEQRFCLIKAINYPDHTLAPDLHTYRSETVLLISRLWMSDGLSIPRIRF